MLTGISRDGQHLGLGFEGGGFRISLHLLWWYNTFPSLGFRGSSRITENQLKNKMKKMENETEIVIIQGFMGFGAVDSENPAWP